jgi:hypothetical protein
MKRQARGRTGRPRRFVKLGSVKAWGVLLAFVCILVVGEQEWTNGKGLCTYVGVIIFCQYVQKLIIHFGLRLVEFGDVRMFQPIDQHLTSKDQYEWIQHLSNPRRKYNVERARDDTRRRKRGCSRVS